MRVCAACEEAKPIGAYFDPADAICGACTNRQAQRTQARRCDRCRDIKPLTAYVHPGDRTCMRCLNAADRKLGGVRFGQNVRNHLERSIRPLPPKTDFPTDPDEAARMLIEGSFGRLADAVSESHSMREVFGEQAPQLEKE